MRDDRLFIIACDDTYAPKQYFEFFRIARVQVHVVPTADGTSAAEHVLARLETIDHAEDDERWMLLDCDHYTQGNHLKSFMAVLAKARQKGINVALSKPCFELWLLLHRRNESAARDLPDAKSVEAALREELGSYNKAALRKDDFPLASVPDACSRAQKLDEAAGGEIPSRNTSRVFLVWRAITSKALPSQLPESLKALLG
ncbi:MAG TPA: RloB family protein [Candidatus Angelobacter sp.]|nr:RloB family protein [Candidatus Angelobacter sp.]